MSTDIFFSVECSCPIYKSSPKTSVKWFPSVAVAAAVLLKERCRFMNAMQIALMLCVKHSGFQVSTRLRPTLRPVFHFRGIETCSFISSANKEICYASQPFKLRSASMAEPTYKCRPATQHLFSLAKVCRPGILGVSRTGFVEKEVENRLYYYLLIIPILNADNTVV